MNRTMNRTEEAEARRKVNQAKTWYAKLVEKNRQAEAEYEAKIARLENEWAELSGEAEHQHQLKLVQIQREREERASRCKDPWEAAAIRQGLVWL
jgi:hypothetical protein